VGPVLKSAAATAVALALLGAMPAARAEGDRNEVYFGVSTAWFKSSTALAAWPDGGLGKLRYADDGVQAVRLFAEYHGRITPTLNARVVADYVDDGASGVGIDEAYIDWRPIPHSASQQQVRFGAFYPPLSLENVAHGWESPFTYSYSAINTWLGEEVRPLGAEWSLRRKLAGSRNMQELRVFASGFYGNDPAATLLFWRGWSLHDRQTRLNDRLQIPPAPIFGAAGAVIGTTPQTVRPFVETDHRPGYYAGVEWRYARRALVQLAHYDNRTDPASFADGQWGWDTSFDHLAVQVALPAELGLMAQWMRGSTYWLAGASPNGGPIMPWVQLVEDAFDANYLMLTRKWHAAHRVSVRYDRFSIEREHPAPTFEGDGGHAWTASYRYEPNERFSGGVEWLGIQSRRDVWPYFYGVPHESNEEQLRFQFSLRLGAPARR
jgi:hypothetical protein